MAGTPANGPSTRLNLVHLTTFHEFARRGTLAAAAQQLGYTPGAASQHLAALERELDTSLATKVGRQLVLTDAGRVLASYAATILDTEREAIRATSGVADSIAGPLLIGTWGSTAASLLAPLVEGMAQRHPDVVIRSREVDLDEVTRAVRSAEVDLAFGLDYADQPLALEQAISVVRLLEEEFSVVVSAKTRTGLRGQPADLEFLAGLGWILPPASSRYGAAIRNGFRRLGFEPRVVHEVTDTAASLRLASADLGATLTTDLMQRMTHYSDLLRLPMFSPISRQIVLITPAADQHRRSISAVVELAKEIVATTLDDRTLRSD